jgi:phosphoribosylformylglycinamidine synthase
MKFVAEIDIMPHKELLDPQGKAVSHNLKSLNIHEVEDVRIGKHITLTLEAETEEAAREIVDTACRKLLANLIMESFAFELTAIE